MIRLGRYPERGRYDFATIASILDESIFCHVGLADSRGPIVLPTLHGRIDRALYIHGSVLAHWLKGASERDVCVSVTIADGIVLARSAFAHSMNFRSVVVLGRAVTVADAGEKLQALRAISEHACAGRWDDVRPPFRARVASDARDAHIDRNGVREGAERSADRRAGRYGFARLGGRKNARFAE